MTQPDLPDHDDDILAVFDRVMAAEPEIKAAGKPKNRRAAEKRHALKHDDGRRKRATGRTAQFNLKIKPESKAAMVAASQKYDMLLAEMAEAAFEQYLAQLAKRGKK